MNCLIIIIILCVSFCALLRTRANFVIGLCAVMFALYKQELNWIIIILSKYLYFSILNNNLELC
jgi:hypothetical protein